MALLSHCGRLSPHRKALTPSRDIFVSLPPDVSLIPLWGWGLTLMPKLSLLTQPHDWACRWSSQMAQHTPSQMPMLGRSTSSRWQPRTMRLGRGVTGVWLLTPHPGQRNRGISPLKPRPPVSLPIPHPSCPAPPHPVLMPSGSSWEQSLCHTPSLAVTDLSSA